MIKKTTLAFYAFLLTLIASCTDDIEINSPGLQATIDGELFRPEIKKAYVHEDGSLEIYGESNGQIISFRTSTLETGVFKTGQSAHQARFTKYDTKYITQNNVTIGQVEIDEIYNNEITGSFYFENLKSNDGKSISFKNGWIYRLPLENYVEPEEEIIEVEQEEIEEEEQVEVNPCLLNASLTAMINGEELITDNHTAQEFGVQDVSILIRATNGIQEITIVFLKDVTPGTYPLSGSGDYSATYSYSNDKSSALDGTLTITEHDKASKCISGSFEYTTRSGDAVTEGVFDFGY